MFSTTELRNALRFANSFLGPFSFRYVRGNAGDATNLSSLVPHRKTTIGDPAFLPVGSDDSIFLRVIAALAFFVE